jgi:hypothetical protein
VPVEQSFAVEMPVHWAEFYAELKMCQEAELSGLRFKVKAHQFHDFRH